MSASKFPTRFTQSFTRFVLNLGGRSTPCLVNFGDSLHNLVDIAFRTEEQVLEKPHAPFLNLEGMKKLWGRKVSDLAVGDVSLILQWTCQKHGKTLLKAGQWQPTTKVSHVCQYKNDSITLADRVWTCPSCS